MAKNPVIKRSKKYDRSFKKINDLREKKKIEESVEKIPFFFSRSKKSNLDIIKLNGVGRDNLYRLKVSKFRVFFETLDSSLEIILRGIEKRDDNTYKSKK